VQMLHAHCVSELCTKLNCGEVLGDELCGRLFPRPPRLFSPSDRLEFFEPLAETAFSNCSILCLEASTILASLTLGAAPIGFAPLVEIRHCAAALFPASHHTANS